MGHMTPHAVLLGLMGEDPESVQVGRLGKVMDEVKAVGEVELGLVKGNKRVKFDLERDLVSVTSIPLGWIGKDMVGCVDCGMGNGLLGSFVGDRLWAVGCGLRPWRGAWETVY